MESNGIKSNQIISKHIFSTASITRSKTTYKNENKNIITTTAAGGGLRYSLILPSQSPPVIKGLNCQVAKS